MTTLLEQYIKRLLKEEVTPDQLLNPDLVERITVNALLGRAKYLAKTPNAFVKWEKPHAIDDYINPKITKEQLITIAKGVIKDLATDEAQMVLAKFVKEELGYADPSTANDNKVFVNVLDEILQYNWVAGRDETILDV